MQSFPRLNEYKTLAYRVFLAFVFYTAARFLFYFYNAQLIKVDSWTELMPLAYHGLAFDATAILYVNALFILLSVLPFTINTRKGYQLVLKTLYFVTNLFAFSLNFVDFIYYRYSFNRSTRASLDIVEHETNKTALLANFLVNYWHVFVLFLGMAILWIYLYEKQKVKHGRIAHNLKYFFSSTVMLLLIAFLCIGGIRGDFRKSIRPINIDLRDAGKTATKITEIGMNDWTYKTFESAFCFAKFINFHCADFDNFLGSAFTLRFGLPAGRFQVKNYKVHNKLLKWL